nr:MAG TPA: hypothetical protein [Caudoviricetes sp.]
MEVGITRKRYFYVFSNSIMTSFFKKVNVSYSF